MSEREEREIDGSRRSFLKKTLGTCLTVGAATAATGCSDGNVSGGEGWLPEQYNIPGNYPVQVRGRIPIDRGNPSITRDDRKCILCGQCAEVCEKSEAVLFNYELPLKDDIPCIHCGQCTLWCPTAAITERDEKESVLHALENENLHVVVQTAPSTRVGLGEEFGLTIGINVESRQVAALKALGFDSVLDTNFAADLTIMEEANELVKRVVGQIKAPLPQFTSCCPGWVKFCEYFYPDLLENLSSAKSPMQMQGALIKTYYAKERNLDPQKIVSVAIMPCTAKKFEAARHEFNSSAYITGYENIRDVDYVLTTRELARLIKIKNIDFNNLPSASYDPLMSEYSGAGAIFGVTGGVMEAAVRTGYYMLTEQRPPDALFNLTPVRGLQGVKEAVLQIPNVGELRVAVVTGMANSREVLKRVRNGDAPWHFIEFMACYGGCISGGGQPRSALPPSDAVRAARINSLYTADEKSVKRLSHENDEILEMYKIYLGEPGGELAHKLLHTHYIDRSMHLTAKKALA
ncbi:MAG: [FeFe] hydrogenase, group A [Deferribacteraceae bacterium]|jgi:iron-only hydrogenase group A|nr:[FeFe] hydrogenase, group A [Deferribacteraceae bacterium]